MWWLNSYENWGDSWDRQQRGPCGFDAISGFADLTGPMVGPDRAGGSARPVTPDRLIMHFVCSGEHVWDQIGLSDPLRSNLRRAVSSRASRSVQLLADRLGVYCSDQRHRLDATRPLTTNLFAAG